MRTFNSTCPHISTFSLSPPRKILVKGLNPKYGQLPLPSLLTCQMCP